MLPQVVKRNGTKENFSVINIARVATASGLTPDQAKQVAETLEKWAASVNVPEITSLQVRDQMLQELPKYSENAAELYKWYEQTKGQ